MFPADQAAARQHGQQDRIPHIARTYTTMPWATSNQPWTSGDSPPLFVEGYSNLLSYKPGDELRLHVNTSVDSFDVEIARIGSEREVVETLSQVAGGRWTRVWSDSTELSTGHTIMTVDAQNATTTLSSKVAPQNLQITV